jgi:phage tail P2-like protein
VSGAAGPGSSLAPASSIRDQRTQALLSLTERLGQIDLSPLLLYTISNAPDAALPFLAWQFDILAPWWKLLSGPLSQRQLIQQAIALHRFRGTPYAIQSITENLGFGLVEIQEGQASWGGSAWPPSEAWAVFRVIVTKASIGLASPQPVSWDGITDMDLLLNVDSLEQASSVVGVPVPTNDQAQLLDAIDFFKPVRSWLDSLWFTELPLEEPAIGLSDRLTLTAGGNVIEPAIAVADRPTVVAWAVADTKETAPVYNAHFYHAGVTYGAAEPVVSDSGLVINGNSTE